ncbi:MAG: hypothetical protein IPH13_03975 [Planctomycetes bacterium]|nr:hypothetical protein [Planctomycetota bacterium]MCC7171984.1 hypothetical protein [Planctomycetota bacterium]
MTSSPNTPRAPEPEEDAPLDPRLARLFDQYRSSELFRSERALAKDADAPDRVDVAALAQGRIREPWQRQALARQLIAGASAIERALPALAVPDDDVEEPPAPALRGFIVLAAAAAILVAAFGLAGTLGGALLGSHARIASGSGEEMRSLSEEGTRRVLVTTARPAHAALARVVDGKLIVEMVESDHLTLQLNPNEETLLPLDREITPSASERWLVLLSAEPFEGVLAELFARAARGDVPRGCELREFLVQSH